MPGILSTVLVGAVIVFVVFLAVRKLWRDKKNGKTCCGGSCSSNCYSGCCGCDKKTNGKKTP